MILNYLHVEDCARGTEVGRDGGERGEEEEADRAPQEVPLVVPHGRGQQPGGEGLGVPAHEELLLADLAGVLVHSGQPLLYAGPMDTEIYEGESKVNPTHFVQSYGTAPIF